MGILNSVALGKSRNSAGNITFYNRIGVGCFRQKAGVSPNYKPTAAQQMQQRVFKFVKSNIDASGVMSLLRIIYDAKPKAGKSQTMYNMFYRSFTPHIVMAKPAIFDLPIDGLDNPAIFLGSAGSHSDIFSNGVLGALPVSEVTETSVSIEASVLDSVIAKANSYLSMSDEPFTANDLHVSLFGESKTAASGYGIVYPTSVAPSLSGGSYTLDLTSLMSDFVLSTALYMTVTLAKSKGGAIDTTRRYFSTDSVEIGQPGPITVTTAFTSAGGGGNNVWGAFPLSALTAAGLSVNKLAGVKFTTTGMEGFKSAEVKAKDGTSAQVACKLDVNSQQVTLHTSPSTFTSEDGKIILQFSNEITYGTII